MIIILQVKSVFVLCLALGAASCGSPNNGTGSTTAVPQPVESVESPTAQSGSFIDAPVEGLSYETQTRSGRTTVDGTFEYFAGESIRFSFAGLDLGGTTASGILTPLDLYPRQPQFSQLMMYLLQSIDADGDPSNGIELTDATEAMVLDYVGREDDPRTLPGIAGRPDFLEFVESISRASQQISVNDALTNFDRDIEPFISAGNYVRPNGDARRDTTTYAVRLEDGPMPVIYLNESGDVIGLITDDSRTNLLGLYLQAPNHEELFVRFESERTLITDGSMVVAYPWNGNSDVALLMQGDAIMEIPYSNASSGTAHWLPLRSPYRKSIDERFASITDDPGTYLLNKILALIPSAQAMPTWGTVIDCGQAVRDGDGVSCAHEILVGLGEFIENARGVAQTASQAEQLRRLLGRWQQHLTGAIIALSDEIPLVERNRLDDIASIMVETAQIWRLRGAGGCVTLNVVGCLALYVDTVLTVYEAAELYAQLQSDRNICNNPSPLSWPLIACQDLAPVLRDEWALEIPAGESMTFDLAGLIVSNPLDELAPCLFVLERAAFGLDIELQNPSGCGSNSGPTATVHLAVPADAEIGTTHVAFVSLNSEWETRILRSNSTYLSVRVGEANAPVDNVCDSLDWPLGQWDGSVHVEGGGSFAYRMSVISETAGTGDGGTSFVYSGWAPGASISFTGSQGTPVAYQSFHTGSISADGCSLQSSWTDTLSQTGTYTATFSSP